MVLWWRNTHTHLSKHTHTHLFIKLVPIPIRERVWRLLWGRTHTHAHTHILNTLTPGLVPVAQLLEHSRICWSWPRTYSRVLVDGHRRLQMLDNESWWLITNMDLVLEDVRIEFVCLVTTCSFFLNPQGQWEDRRDGGQIGQTNLKYSGSSGLMSSELYWAPFHRQYQLKLQAGQRSLQVKRHCRRSMQVKRHSS